jgi:hypothetical protein
VLTPPAPVAAAVVLAVAYFLVADIEYPNNSRLGGVYVAALLVASFAALAGLISLDVPAAAALIGLLPVAIVRVVTAWVGSLRRLVHPVGLDPRADT